MADIGDIEPMVDEAFDFMGVGLLEDEIDDVIFLMALFGGFFR